MGAGLPTVLQDREQKAFGLARTGPGGHQGGLGRLPGQPGKGLALMGMGNEIRGQPVERRSSGRAAGTKGQWHRQIRPLEQRVRLRQEALDHPGKARRGRGEGGLQEIGDPLGELLGDDQGLHD